MIYTIYLHKNKTNGKCYVGQTRQSTYKRWQKGKGYKHSTKFYNAILKYGWDNFEHIILCKCNGDEVDQKEKYYIQKYDSIKNEYNISQGGLHNEAVTEETREKIRQKLKGVSFTTQRKKNISKSLLGKKLNPASVCKRSNTVIQNHEKSEMGYIYRCKNYWRVRIDRLHICRYFRTIEEAKQFKKSSLNGDL